MAMIATGPCNEMPGPALLLAWTPARPIASACRQERRVDWIDRLMDLLEAD
jgi:hypothetical protein